MLQNKQRREIYREAVKIRITNITKNKIASQIFDKFCYKITNIFLMMFSLFRMDMF